MNRPEPFAASDASARLVIHCLGRFRCTDETGRDLPIRTRKARAILAYAAVSGQPASRDRLTALLWSERGEEQARASLRQALFELRHLNETRRPPIIADRDDLSLDAKLVATDLQLIRAAADCDDASGLQSLLSKGRAGLLTDLDGLDPEFDAWLRSVRAEEPARTLDAALNAAGRQLELGAIATARDLVSEVQRIDPANEPGTRLSMRIDHAAGDMGSLHRHYERFQASFREEYAAEPSPETQQLFLSLSKSEARSAAITEPRPDQAAGSPPQVIAKRQQWARPISFVLLLAGLIATALLWRGPNQGSTEPLVLAVLPFEAETSGDRFIASGLWEHTRAALTRNPSMRILGRTTTAAMVERKLTPAQYRQRLQVTHILEGSLRRTGSDVLVSVSLTRTSDGVAIWHDMFRGRMGEPLALQGAIANGIEGKLRGRLAVGGGRRAEHISTTPEVYALYSEARGLMAARERSGIKRAEALMRDAVRRDPNYAPAWSLLGGTIYFNRRIAIEDSSARDEALAAIRRALSLAPNLAQAHATLALVEGGNAPSEAPLRRAVALDPNYAEAWNWLGNSLNSQFRRQEALAAYERSLTIDPLFSSAIQNYASTAAETGDQQAYDRLLTRITAVGAEPLLISGIKANQLYNRRDYSAAVDVLMAAGRSPSGERHDKLWGNWLDLLAALGHYDSMHDITGCPDWYGPMLQSKILPPSTFEGRPVAPGEFWTSTFFSTPASRAMANLGRHRDLVQLYRAAYRTPDEFISETAGRGLLSQLAPNLALTLETEGARDEGRYILAAAARRLEPFAARPGNTLAMPQLALIRAAQGQDAEALRLLEGAMRAGWLPDGRNITLDLAGEPTLRRLRGQARFEAIRQKILAHIARERAETPPIGA